MTHSGVVGYFHTKAVLLLNMNVGNRVFITNPLQTL